MTGPSPALRSDDMFPARVDLGSPLRSDLTRSQALRPASSRPRSVAAGRRVSLV